MTIKPQACKTMQDVRKGVDALDRELVALLVTRQAYMAAAARIKPNRDAVYDKPRIEDVVAKVIAESNRVGLSPDISEPVWRLLIDRCIAHEYTEWDKHREPKRDLG